MAVNSLEYKSVSKFFLEQIGLMNTGSVHWPVCARQCDGPTEYTVNRPERMHGYTRAPCHAFLA